MLSDADIFLENYKEEIEKQVTFLDERAWHTDTEDVVAAHSVQFLITSSLVNRIEYFFTVGGRDIMGRRSTVREFILDTAEAISMYPENVKRYISDNDWREIQSFDEQEEELKFQDMLMTNAIRIHKSLQELNIENKIVSLNIPIRGDRNAPFLMRHILDAAFPQIKQYMDQQQLQRASGEQNAE